MERILTLLPVLGCGGGMGLCMWLMNKGHRSSDPTDHAAGGQDPEVAELRAEIARLRAEVAERRDQTV